ncbi:hypothetical protein [Neorhizobium galegae]|uniref:Uncharacterized protein n=1 Tax=Neorhizobium galegae bv. officinalis TaxID=323656 RepID=A0A0T7H0N1_NEOGA|nr:hypothetical protein [Neorhizobium galegae]CDZ53075.1 Hypothetical protein NGAL_HAMBI1189_48070 [Neorhizobium galegae bv. officinalis]
MKSPRPNPDDALRAVSDLVEYFVTGRHVPDDSRELLYEGFQACIAGNFEPCLFTAIGLKGRGGVSLERQRRKGARDALLAALWGVCDEYRSLPALAASKMMAAHFRRYEETRWPREQRGNVPTSEPQSTWWRILSEGERVPEPKRLQQILENSIEIRGESDAA